MNTTEKHQKWWMFRLYALHEKYIVAQAAHNAAGVALDKARRAENKAWEEYCKAWQAYKETL